MTKEQWLEEFDEWNDVTGYFTKHTSQYFEMQAFIKKTREEAIKEVVGYVTYICIEDEKIAKQVYDKLYDKYLQNNNPNTD